MKKGDKKKWQKALKRRTESKLARQQGRAAGATSALHHIRHARDYPIEGCWAQKGWGKAGLAVVVVARRQPDRNIVFGTYLVDYYCLGLKDAYYNANIPPGQFRRDHLPKMLQGQPLSISPALAHEIIYGAIEYAAQFGFRPHPDFKRAQYVLDPPDMHPRTGKVEFGKDGKPFYISGPYDNAEAIVRQLARKVGEGNYHYMMQIDGPPPDEWD